MYCKKCHYSLQGLERQECPECGRKFDVGDPYTFDPNPWSPTHEKFHVVKFIAVAYASLLSGSVVWASGDALTAWHMQYPRVARLQWDTLIAARFNFAGLVLLVSLILAVYAMRGAKRPSQVRMTKVARCIAFATATWWIGWYLALRFGYVLFPI